MSTVTVKNSPSEFPEPAKGDSAMPAAAVELLTELRTLGVRLFLADGELKIDAPRGVIRTTCCSGVARTNRGCGSW